MAGTAELGDYLSMAGGRKCRDLVRFHGLTPGGRRIRLISLVVLLLAGITIGSIWAVVDTNRVDSCDEPPV
jgi:predicted ester cyclase